MLPQRSPVLTAQYWNPILQYVSRKSGITLKLKLTKTGGEHARGIREGRFDLIYSNHNFMPDNDRVGYAVIARPIEPAIRGQIVVLADSTVRAMTDLQDADVVFPSPAAFVGYHVPMDALRRSGIRVKPLFAGNQVGALVQLTSGRAQAAGINSHIAQDFAQRQNQPLRVIWSSDEFLNMPISAHPALPASSVLAIRAALLGMADDPEGRQILHAAAALLNQTPPYGFLAAGNPEYDNVRRFYKHSVLAANR